MQKQRAVLFFFGSDGLKLFLFGFVDSSEPSWMWQRFQTTDGEIRKQRTEQISAKLKSSGFSLLISFCRKSWGRSGSVLLLVMHFLNLNNFLSCGLQHGGGGEFETVFFIYLFFLKSLQGLRLWGWSLSRSDSGNVGWVLKVDGLILLWFRIF